MKYSEQIDKQFKLLMQSQFGDYLVVGFINGRGAFKMTDPTMDIDTFVILDDRILKDKKLFQKKWASYVKGYRYSVTYGYKPDNAFPAILRSNLNLRCGYGRFVNKGTDFSTTDG
jgi:hypothetical protein